MKDGDSDDLEIDAGLVLRAYAAGVFPMAEGRASERIFWVDPKKRGILPLAGFHVSRSLRRTLLKGTHSVTVNRDFEGVLDGCADREETWINEQIRGLYLDLFRVGHAHSVEVWNGGELAGGIYGVTLGAVFFGESMFSRRPNGSKIALAWLVARLKAGGFQLFDTQFTTDHLERLGARNVPRQHYRGLLEGALRRKADFHTLAPNVTVDEVLAILDDK